MTPSLWFQQHPTICYNLYNTLVASLEKAEGEKYPDYQEILAKKWEEYREHEKKIKDMDSIDRQNGDDYCPTMSDQFRLPQPPPLGQPHPKFVNFPPGKALKPADLESLVEKLAREMHLKQPERHPLIRGLRRGIGIYLYHLPLAYLQMVQRLAQEGILGVVFSDISLAYGVNMPFRTVVFCGDHPNLDSLVAKQMSGRAGRRGMDTQGNLVYFNLEWSKICALNWGSLVNITGRDTRYSLMGLQESFAPGSLTRTARYPLCNHTSTSSSSSSPSSLISPETSDTISLEEYPRHSSNMLSLTGILTTSVHPFSDLLWHLRQYPREACALWMNINTLRRMFSHRRDERDDVNMFLYLCHIVCRYSSPIDTSTQPLPSLDTIRPGVEVEFNEIQSTLPESLQLLDITPDPTLFTIFRDNKIPEGYTPDMVDTTVRRFREIGEICRIYRNRIILKPEYLQLEEILRKTFRRVYYVILAC